MFIMKHRSSRTFSLALALAFAACALAEGRAQDGIVCPPSTTIGDFCKDRWTLSSIVKFPEAKRWIRGKSPGSENTTDRARLTISCDHDGVEKDHRDDGMTMFLWHQSVGTIGLAYSKMLPGAGLIFSMVQFDASSRNASGTTPGTFAMLNRCELQRRGGHVTGLLFDASQILPLSFNGIMDKDSSDWTTSKTESVETTVSPSDLDALKFSGIYEFEREDEECLTKKGLMKSDKQRSPDERLGLISQDLRVRTQQQYENQRSGSWENVCPPRKARLVVDAVAGDRPIFNVHFGTFVAHHVVGPKWDGKRFHSVTPNGDTTGPNAGMFKIDGEMEEDGSLNFFLYKPNVGKTGRLWPVVGSPKIWMTVDRFHAVKQLDAYCHLDIAPPEHCASWKDKDKKWLEYWIEVWKQNQKWLQLQ
jgi:hypothetical protein